MLKDFSEIPMDIIIVAGQSNANGAGLGAVEEPYVPKENVWSLNNDFTISKECEHIERNDVRGGFRLQFVDEYLKAGLLSADRQLLMVNGAVGGTGFAKHQWGEGEVLSERLFEMTKTALDLNKENKIKAFLWHQGEQEINFNTPSDVYEEKISRLYNNFIYKFGDDYPIIAGDFVPIWKREKGYDAERITERLRKVIMTLKHGYFVESEGLKSNFEDVKDSNEKIHFSRKDSQELGKRYFEKYKQFLKL